MKYIFTLITTCFFALTASAQPGTLDKSFGKGGKIITTGYTGDCQAVITQQDGKIITAGRFEAYDFDSAGILISRFNTDGSVDASFGDSGKVIISKTASGYGTAAVALAIQKDQKILAYGRFVENRQGIIEVGVVRLNRDGSYDTNFGDSGVAVTSAGINDIAGDMALQEDGKIVVTGNKGVKESQFSPAFIIRYMPDGRLDKNFGTTGIIYTQLPTIFTCKAIAVTAGNKILIGGVYESSSSLFAVLQYNADGTLDESFGVSGIAKLFPQVGNFSYLNDLALQEDGKILATGEYGIGELVLARFYDLGKIDSGFGEKHIGYTIFLPEKGYAKGKNVYPQNQNIIVTGIYSNTDIYTTGTNTGFGAFSFKTDGTFDSGFGDNGVASSGFDVPIFTMGTGVGALEPDGKIVVGGAVAASEAQDFFNIGLVRFNGGLSKKQILITKIKKWLQHHNGFIWDNAGSIKNYAVQRSGDGMNWTTVNRPQAVVNSQRSTVNYYNDPSPLSGNNYYRLQTTSVNGAVNYSNVIAVTADEVAVTISPNPAKNNLQIQGLSSKAKLTVVDFTGNIKLQALANATSYNLNIASLAIGNYLLKIEMNGEVATKKFVKE